MAFPRDVLELENRSLSRSGEPTLFRAYERLLAEWRGGSRDREVGLHLMFLAWYLLCEPPYFTGFLEESVPSSTLAGVFHEVHDHFEPTIRNDAEMLYVVGLMAKLFPYLLGSEAEMTALGEQYLSLYRTLVPGGLPPDVFAERGAYGSYFAEQCRFGGGY